MVKGETVANLLSDRNPPSESSEEDAERHTYENSLQRKNLSISPNGRRERFDFWTDERPVQAPSRTRLDASENADREDTSSRERVYANTLPRTAPNSSENSNCKKYDIVGP